MRSYLVAVAIAVAIVTVTVWLVAYPWGCSGVDVETITKEQRVALIGQGWRGDPDDERDAIYPPECAP